MSGHKWVAGLLMMVDQEDVERLARELKSERFSTVLDDQRVDLVDLYCDHCRVRWEVATDSCTRRTFNDEEIRHQRMLDKARQENAAKTRAPRLGKS